MRNPTLEWMKWLKTPFSFLPELSFFSTLHWIKLLYRAAEECLLLAVTSMYLIVFGDIPCSASPGIFLSKWFFISLSDTPHDLKLSSLLFSWALKALIFKKLVITSRIIGNFETIESWPHFLHTDNFGCFSTSSSTLITTDVSLLESIFKIWSTTSPQFAWWKLTIYSSRIHH